MVSKLGIRSATAKTEEFIVAGKLASRHRAQHLGHVLGNKAGAADFTGIEIQKDSSSGTKAALAVIKKEAPLIDAPDFVDAIKYDGKGGDQIKSLVKGWQGLKPDHSVFHERDSKHVDHICVEKGSIGDIDALNIVIKSFRNKQEISRAAANVQNPDRCAAKQFQGDGATSRLGHMEFQIEVLCAERLAGDVLVSYFCEAALENVGNDPVGQSALAAVTRGKEFARRLMQPRFFNRRFYETHGFMAFYSGFYGRFKKDFFKFGQHSFNRVVFDKIPSGILSHLAVKIRRLDQQAKCGL